MQARCKASQNMINIYALKLICTEFRYPAHQRARATIYVINETVFMTTKNCLFLFARMLCLSNGQQSVYNEEKKLWKLFSCVSWYVTSFVVEVRKRMLLVELFKLKVLSVKISV